MYDKTCCNPYEKSFYRPIDAAIRWCNLMDHEVMILESPWDCYMMLSKIFPQWPCLQTNTDKIIDAVRNLEIPYGSLGTTVAAGTHVDYKLLTVRHSDLIWWMSRRYPDQRPDFLFGRPTSNDERISYGTYLTLRADRDALELQLKSSEAVYLELIRELKALGLEHENLRVLAKNHRQISERSEIAYLNVIGGLLNTLLGSSPSGRSNSIFNSQASIVDSITAHYKGVLGLSKRSLDEKFATAKRSLLKNQ